tara:strand:- start:7187 stop:7480 length:294 start_codon:yes stop_codon:yes gene_type:complete
MKISESTNLTLDLKTLILIIGFTVSMVMMYAKLQADIKIAMDEPKPSISSTEFEMKDLLIRENIKNTLIITENNAQGIQELKEKLIVIENRLYEINK